MVDDAAAIKRRLILQTTSIASDAPFTKLVKTFSMFQDAIRKHNEEQKDSLHQQLMADIYEIQQYLQRLQAASTAATNEQAMYSQDQERLEAGIVQSSQDIEDRKQQLEAARLQLVQQKKYETVKEKIVQVQARSTTRREMDAVQKEIEDLTQQSKQLEGLMTQRKEQLASIRQFIEQVHANIQGQSTAGGGQTEAMATENEAGEAMEIT